MEGFIGSVVSIYCGEVLGTYQGVVTQIDSAQQTLTLADPFCNGLKGKVPSVTIK
jgi:enhancer of mRNA-decapping protein 3